LTHTETPVAGESKDVEDLLTLASRWVNQRRWDDAARVYRELLERSPDHVEALEGLGLAALHGGRDGEGLAWLTKARERAPENARVVANHGLAQKKNGLLRDAIETYRRAVALAPSFPTLVNLARAEREAGRLSEAITTFQRALELDGEAADAWSMLSNALREAGRLDSALAAAREGLSKNPWLGQGHLNEGSALHRLGQLADAVVSYWIATKIPASRKAALANLEVALRDPSLGASTAPELAHVRRLLARPDDAAAMLELARREKEKRRTPTALCCFECAAEAAPSATTFQESAALAWRLGQHDQAQARMLRSFDCDDVDVNTWRRFSSWLISEPRFHLARPAWRPILARCPDDWISLVNLGVAIQRRGFPSEAEGFQRRAMAMNAQGIEPYANLGVSLNDQGRTQEAIALYRECLEKNPDAAAIASNLVFTLHFDPALSPDAIFAEHVAFGRTFADPWSAEREYPHERNPERRLRIGYVSPDFRWHPVSYFLDPVLDEHDAERFEVSCYSDVERPDEVTKRCEELVQHFTPCRGWSDEKLAAQIESDKIDILVDLAGHTGNNRLMVFARKPSPIQVSWLGYFDTTGVRAIDYRIADEHALSKDAERFFVERVLRLPRSQNCFRPTAAPDPAPPPCLERGKITFGCYNNPSKIGRHVISTFSRILLEVPDSRLVLKYAMFDDPVMRARYASWFEADGIALDRIDFRGHSSMDAFMKSFADIDIALDPFPYSGETTAVHTLWMGVPLVALEGETAVQRLASRVLRVAGFGEWVATSIDDYTRIARSLACTPGADLASARARQRERLRASPLLDYRGVTRDLEGAYRAMWRSFCSGEPLPK
jgi:predicted O-linked N-acetylglucosamine transferase (SPINDLY family)